jgi:hypothetical protein
MGTITHPHHHGAVLGSTGCRLGDRDHPHGSARQPDRRSWRRLCAERRTPQNARVASRRIRCRTDESAAAHAPCVQRRIDSGDSHNRSHRQQHHRLGHAKRGARDQQSHGSLRLGRRQCHSQPNSNPQPRVTGRGTSSGNISNCGDCRRKVIADHSLPPGEDGCNRRHCQPARIVESTDKAENRTQRRKGFTLHLSFFALSAALRATCLLHAETIRIHSSPVVLCALGGFACHLFVVILGNPTNEPTHPTWRTT